MSSLCGRNYRRLRTPAQVRKPLFSKGPPLECPREESWKRTPYSTSYTFVQQFRTVSYSCCTKVFNIEWIFRCVRAQLVRICTMSPGIFIESRSHAIDYIVCVRSPFPMAMNIWFWGYVAIGSNVEIGFGQWFSSKTMLLVPWSDNRCRSVMKSRYLRNHGTVK